MPKQATSAALERLEGLTAEFLEIRIAEVEKAHGIHIKEIEVALVMDGRGRSPAVTVFVSI